MWSRSRTGLARAQDAARASARTVVVSAFVIFGFEGAGDPLMAVELGIAVICPHHTQKKDLGFERWRRKKFIE